MSDFLEYILPPTLFFCFILCVIVAVANIGGRIGCENQAEIMGVNHKYGFFEGCLFEVKGQHIPKANLNMVDLLGGEE